MATEIQLLTEEWTNDDINSQNYIPRFFKLPLYMYWKNWSHPLQLAKILDRYE